MKEQTLSDKLEKFKKDWQPAINGQAGIDATKYCEQLFKDFIKKLKEELPNFAYSDQPVSEICGIIDKLAGDKLI
jgi:hypothetical protein